ncbi:MAG: hypothetical protein E4H40_01080 [Candidatus Brocadiia bacterium]|nr:MAG: hypothetical protein E4H40_01080 [Candidatus Brocadiia bacterium]
MGKKIFTAVIIVLFCANSIVADTQSTMREAAERIVSKYKGVFNSPPVNVPTNKVPDGPLLGNGDVGVVISGDPELQRFWVSKNDFWMAKEGNHRAGGPKLFGGIDIRILALRGAKYYVEQSVYEPAVTATFTTKDSTVTMRSWLPDSENLIFIELSVTGMAVSVEADLWAKTGFGTTTKQTDEKLHFVTRKFNSPDLKYATEAAMALRTIGADPNGHLIIEDSGKFVFEGAKSNRFGLQPGGRVILAAAISTNHDTGPYEQDVRDRVGRLTIKDIANLWQEHKQWWHDFWAKSFVEIGDPVIEKFYYGSLCLLASCSRNKEFPPSLIGNWVTTDNAGWHGDYHTNYNHEAPWWGAFSSNHVELADPYDAPIIDFIDRAKYYAKTELNCRGVYFPVGIGPRGLETTLNPPDGYPPSDGVDKGYFLGQKSNAAYTTVDMIMRFYHTYDMESVKNTAYPYLIEVLNFWEDYLKFENGRYVIYDDSVFELAGQDINNLLSLGLIRLIFRAAIDMSIELGVDANRREKWQHVLDHISDFALLERNGKTVFRFAEKGVDWRSGEGGGMVAVQHIWPTGAIGLHCRPEIIQIAKDHITAIDGWDDYNGFCTFYTAAARVGYDPNIILRNLRDQCLTRGQLNLHIFHGGGGVEELSGTVSCIDEMLLQSYSKILRLFPTWPKDRRARFANLRAVGAFLVSGAYNDGQAQYVLIHSEKGRDCTLQNPWHGRNITIYSNSRKAETLGGETVTFKTSPGERITVAPEGVSLENIQSRVKDMEAIMTRLAR